MKSPIFDRSALTLIIVTALFYSFPVLAATPASLTARNPVYDDQVTCVANSQLQCYATNSGTRLWNNNSIHDARGLVLLDGLLYLTQHRTVKIFNASNGSPVKSIPHKSMLFDPVVTADQLILSDQDGTISVLNRQDYSLKWSRKIDTGWVYPPSVVNDKIITGGQSGILWSMNINDGEPLWNLNLGQELVYRPVISRDGIIVSTFDGSIRMLDTDSGTVLWKNSLDSAAIDIQRTTLNTILASGFDGYLYALDSLTGQLLWQVQAHSSARFNYFSDENHIASIDHLGNFKLFNLYSGDLIGTSNIEGHHQASPVMMNSILWLFPDDRPALKLNLSSIK